MLLNCRKVPFTLPSVPCPTKRIACRLEAFVAPSRRREARPQGPALLFAVAVLAVLPVLCWSGFARPGSALTVNLSAVSLSFGNVTVGLTSSARTVSLNNASNAALAIQGIAITGANAADFAQTNNCGGSVGIGANCTISVSMRPSASGRRQASLSIADGNAGGRQSVVLTGMGISPSLNLFPASISFGSVPLGATSAVQTMNVSNSGPGVLVIAGVYFSGADAGDFALTNNCRNSIAAWQSCTIGVTFTPLASGSRVAAVNIADNASGGAQTVSLFGIATGPPTGPPGKGNPPAGVSLSPSNLSFPGQPVATTGTTETIALTNGTNAALSMAGLIVTGTNAGDFAEIANTCGASVAAGGTCTIGVAFTPSGAGQRMATLSINDNASGSPQTINLTGSGCADIILSWASSTTPGVVGYNIYRGTAPGAESGTPINSAPVNAGIYVDTSVKAGMTYYYVLTSVSAYGAESPRSSETEANVPTS